MTCEHLRPLEQAIIGCGIRETFRGSAWSKNCREWVYFDCYLDIETIRVGRRSSAVADDASQSRVVQFRR